MSDATRRWERRDTLAAVVVFLVALLPRVAAVPAMYLNTHAARDLYRALWWLRGDYFPLAGPELFFGGRVPGNFYYAWLAIPMSTGQGAWAAGAWIALWTSVAAALAYVAIRLVAGRCAALVAALAYALFPLALVETMYLWNPSHMPFFSALALLGLALWLGHRRPGGLVLLLVAGLLLMQVHLSGYVLLVVGLATFAGLWIAGRGDGDGRRGARVAHVLVALVLVAPFCAPWFWQQGAFAFLDLPLEMEGDRKGGLFTTDINPTALGTAASAIFFRDDTQTHQQFLHFTRFFRELREGSPRMAALLDGPATWLSALVFGGGFLLGIAGCLAGAFLPGSGAPRRSFLLATRLRPDAARPICGALLLWIGTPLFVAAKLVGHDPESYNLGIPTRYFVIWYPASMAVIGLGIAWMAGMLASTLSRRTVLGVVAAALATHAGICGLFIQRAITSGATFDYLGSPMDPCKPLLTEARLARILVREHGATLETLRERFLTDGNFVDVRSEQFIDLGLLERGGDGPDGASPDHWFYLYDHTRMADPPPLILQSGEIIARHEVAQFTLLVIQRDDPSAIVWPQVVVTPQGFL